MLIDGFTEVGTSLLLLVEEVLTYNEAKTRCEGFDSKLVEFWNHQEWNEVTKTLSDITFPFSDSLNIQSQITQWANTTQYFIALTDLENEGTFVWDSGRPLSAEGASHWMTGQPNSGGGFVDEDCVDVGHSDGSIRDQRCTTKRKSICQRKLSGGNK